MTTIKGDSPAPGESWFYEQKGQRIGGVDENTMISLIQSGQLGYGSSVWKQGLSDWVKLEETALREHLDRLAPPPLTGTNVNNTLVWVLAFAPFLGLFLEGVIAMIVYGDEDWAMEAVYAGQFFYITIALNILLCVLDEKRLQKAGHNTRAFKGWVWLVPVYLYQRAKHLKHNLAYFIVWICCFVLLMLGIALDDGAHNEQHRAGYQSHTTPASARASNQNLSSFATLGDVIDSCVDSWVKAYREEVGPEAMVVHGQLQEWEDWCKQGQWP